MRDPVQQPFSHLSPWNIPMATTAVFESADDPRTATLIDNVQSYPWITTSTNYNLPISLAKATDPEATVTDTVYAMRSARFRIPEDAAIATGTDRTMLIIDPTRRWAHECFDTTRISPTEYTVRRHEQVDLYGTGMGPTNGPRAFGGSGLGGMVRKSDVESGEIAHAIAIAIDWGHLYYAGGPWGYDAYGYATAQGYVWPATEQDSYGAQRYRRTLGVPMGSYFGIPRDVDVEALPFTEPAKQVCRGFQRRGGYVVDATSGTFSLLTAEDSVPREWIDAVWPHIAQIRSMLRIVKNNTPDTPNGGELMADASNRMAPMLAPLAPPAPVIQ